MQTQTTGTATMTETAGAANTPWDHEQAQSTVMARLEAGAQRYAAGLARLDAAVKAAPPVREGDPCPLCGARRVQREYERGLRSWWIACPSLLCGWQERDPDQRGLLLDVRA